MTALVVSNPFGAAVFAVALLIVPMVLVALAHMERNDR